MLKTLHKFQPQMDAKFTKAESVVSDVTINSSELKTILAFISANLHDAFTFIFLITFIHHSFTLSYLLPFPLLFMLFYDSYLFYKKYLVE